MRAFHVAPEHEAWRIVERHPALLLPELIDAAEQVLGRSRAIDGLREMHLALRGSPAYAPYHRLLATALTSERRGSRRINLDRALVVIKDVRRAAGGDARDEHAERTIRDALETLTRPPTALTALDALLLDDGELVGLRPSQPPRHANPHGHDRAFAVNRGLAAGFAEWLGDVAAPVYGVVDARWVFASTAAARAYLDSPGTLLLSRDGLANPAMLQIGDGAHAWGNAPAGRGRQCLLFRVGRVVARIDATEGPRAAQALQTLKRAHLSPYAAAVIRRVQRVLAQYWLGVGSGTAAAQQVLHTQPRKLDQLMAEYPIILLPEFPTAMASLGQAYVAAAERLVTFQGTVRSQWQLYRETLRALVRRLLDETAGEPRVNADAALRLVTGHRRLDADYAWAALEDDCRARDDAA